MMPPPRPMVSSFGKPLLRMRQNKPTEALRGEDIRRLRTRLDLTQPQLAWLLAVSLRALQGWEAADRKRCSAMSEGMRENVRIIIEGVREHGDELVNMIRACVGKGERKRAEYAVLHVRFGNES